MSTLVDRLMILHDKLTEAGFKHAFGGAIALAYCTAEPRGTRDLDINIFTDSSNAEAALAALPTQVKVTPADIADVARDGQTRLWWEDTPIDVFLNNIPYHDEVSLNIVWVPLEDRTIPVLDCASLVVFKALFNRTKDWADIEAVAEQTPADIDRALAAVAGLVGKNDPICTRLDQLRSAN